MSSHNVFDITGRVAVITGGAGLLGEQHARAIAGAGGIPVLLDISGDLAQKKADELARSFGVQALGLQVDISNPRHVKSGIETVLNRFDRVDILINNAANNAMVETDDKANFSRFESFTLEQWEADMAVGLRGAFLCCQTVGTEMAHRGRGVILNVASDLALIGPDQRIY